MFESAPQNPPDSIFGLIEQFKKDENPLKINLSVGGLSGRIRDNARHAMCSPGRGEIACRTWNQKLSPDRWCSSLQSSNWGINSW